MISSKRINLISALLTCAALALILCAVFLDKNPQKPIAGTVYYGDLHEVTYTKDDYYSNYSEGSVVRIDLTDRGASCGSKNVAISDSSVTILSSGTYILSGSYDGSIIVDSENGGTVRLILNGVQVTRDDFSPLYIKQADKTILSAVKDTENIFTDGTEYNSDLLSDSKPSAAVYSKDDLTVNGEGTIIVNGNYQDGIKVNDSLKLIYCNITVNAADDGINANDSVVSLNSSVSVTSESHGIKCDDAEKGFIALDSSKAVLNCKGDGIHADGDIIIKDGEYEITSEDDGIHADKNLILSPNRINIPSSLEGIEGGYVTINSGDINLCSKDDGINAVGINPPSGFDGGNEFKNSPEDIYLTINGGNIRIETEGDGVDSNGSAVMNGGNLAVFGPENNGNGSLDVGDRGYVFLMNGGSLLCAGSGGMAQLPDKTSKQPSAAFYLDTSYPAESTLSVKDGNSEEIISCTSSKSFNFVCFSYPSLSLGGKYTLYIDNTAVGELELTENVSLSGGENHKHDGFMPGDPHDAPPNMPKDDEMQGDKPHGAPPDMPKNDNGVRGERPQGNPPDRSRGEDRPQGAPPDNPNTP